MKNTAREISFHFIPSKWGECHYLFPQPSKIEFCRAFFFSQNVLFFYPKGILNQAKMTPGFTVSSLPPTSSSFF